MALQLLGRTIRSQYLQVINTHLVSWFSVAMYLIGGVMSTKSSTDAVLIDERAIKNNLTHSLAFFCLDSPTDKTVFAFFAHLEILFKYMLLLLGFFSRCRV